MASDSMTTRVQRTELLLAAPVLGLLIALVSPVTRAIIPSLIGLLVLALSVWLLAMPAPEDRTWIGMWTLTAFVLHVFVGLVIWHVPGLTAFFGGDAVVYDAGARSLADSWRHVGAIPSLPAGKEGFFYMLAVLDYVFGEHADAGIVINGVMAALLVPLSYDTTRRLHGPRAARIAAALATLIPGLILWPAQLLREAGVLALIALAMNAGTRISRRVSLGAMLVLAAAVALLFTFRASTALLLATGMTAGLLLGRRRLTGGIGASAGVAGILVVLVLAFGLGISGFKFVTSSNLAAVNTVRSDSSVSASSGYYTDADVSTGNRAVAYLPIGMAAFLLGPPPWTIGGARPSLSLPDLAVWWCLLPSLVAGILRVRAERGREVLLEFLPALAVTMGLSLIIANFGTTIRERMQVVVILLPLIAYGVTLGSPARMFRPARRGAGDNADARPGQLAEAS
jgi:hypothetical protein